jgi:hypothetical protein
MTEESRKTRSVKTKLQSIPSRAAIITYVSSHVVWAFSTCFAVCCCNCAVEALITETGIQRNWICCSKTVSMRLVLTQQVCSKHSKKCVPNVFSEWFIHLLSVKGHKNNYDSPNGDVLLLGQFAHFPDLRYLFAAHDEVQLNSDVDPADRSKVQVSIYIKYICHDLKVQPSETHSQEQWTRMFSKKAEHCWWISYRS